MSLYSISSNTHALHINTKPGLLTVGFHCLFCWHNPQRVTSTSALNHKSLSSALCSPTYRTCHHGTAMFPVLLFAPRPHSTHLHGLLPRHVLEQGVRDHPRAEGQLLPLLRLLPPLLLLRRLCLSRRAVRRVVVVPLTPPAPAVAAQIRALAGEDDLMDVGGRRGGSTA